MDPDSFNPDTDPDPAYQVNPDPDPIRIQGFDEQKLKKKYSWNYIFFIQNCNLLMSKLQKHSTLKLEHLALKKMEFITFFVCGLFFPSRIRIANPDPDTDPVPHWILIHNTAILWSLCHAPAS